MCVVYALEMEVFVEVFILVIEVVLAVSPLALLAS